MASEGEDYTIQITRVTGKLKERTEKVVKMLAMEVTAEAQKRTPVDTGWAKANWLPRIGEPDRTPRPRVVSELGAKLSEQSKGLNDVLTQYDLERGLVSISNNVPYMEHLNAGSSKKAPAGFIQASISSAISKVQKKIDALKGDE